MGLIPAFPLAVAILNLFFLSGALAACPDDSGLFITSPTLMEALNGSCLQIPCNFSAKSGEGFDSGRTIIGVWIKSDERFDTFPNNVVFNSSKPVNTYSMNITGSLNNTDCTSLFYDINTSYTDIYFFRIENGLFRATAVCDPVTVAVKDSAWSPTINISGELKEKESVTITCSALTPCPHSPPELTWNLQQNSHRQIEENTDGTFTAKIQETIPLSDTHDGYTISCSVRYPVNAGKDVKTAETEVTLNVSYAPKDTSASISPSGLVSAGSWMNLSCSSRANPPISSFTWFKNSKHGAMKVAEGDFYRLNATEGGDYYCVATNSLGNQTSQIIPLNIKGSPGGNILWEAILVGLIAIICLAMIVCIVMYRRQTNESNSTTQQQNRTSEAIQEPERKTEQQEEDLHYGELEFSTQRPRLSSNSAQDRRQELETVYDQVKVSQPQTADVPEDLYVQVKKK